MTFEEIEKETNDKKQFKQKYPKLHSFEKNVLDGKVDHYSNKVVKKMGFRKANFIIILRVLIGIMIIMNIMACYARPDFIT